MEWGDNSEAAFAIFTYAVSGDSNVIQLINNTN